MTATFPAWFAIPPEVHSALLSAGPGPGPLLAAAEAWRTLAAHYADTATELTAILASAQATAWEGDTAERFIAAHQPFLWWLNEVTAGATAAAAGHDTAAASYASAFASMPALTELAANHVQHGALVATNFFGINTIPIALNEADYMRMWIQAATTMSTYQAGCEESLATAPTTPPAPHIVAAAASGFDSGFFDPIKTIFQLFENFLGSIREIAAGFLPGPLRDLVIQILDAFIALVSNPAFIYMIEDISWKLPLIPLVLPLGLPGLGGLAAAVPGENPGPPSEVRHHNDPRQHSPVITTGVTLASTNPTAAAAVGPATTTTGPVPASTPAPAFPADHGLYAIGGPNGEGFTPTARTHAVTAVRAGAPATKLPLEQSQASVATNVAKPRRRSRHYRFESLEDDGRMTLPDNVAAERIVAAGDSMGRIGFAGTSPKTATASAHGLIRLSGVAVGETPRAPMLPGTWTEGPMT